MPLILTFLFFLFFPFLGSAQTPQIVYQYTSQGQFCSGIGGNCSFDIDVPVAILKQIQVQTIFDFNQTVSSSTVLDFQ